MTPRAAGGNGSDVIRTFWNIPEQVQVGQPEVPIGFPVPFSVSSRLAVKLFVE